MTKNYHYTSCGLDYVYLENGYTYHETPHGRGVAIEDAGGLDDVIALAVITGQYRLRGQELRFLRARLELTQNSLARLLGTKRVTVARWEGKRETAIPPAADRMLRLFYALERAGDDVARKIAELLSEIDDLEYQNAVFQETDQGWVKAAA